MDTLRDLTASLRTHGDAPAVVAFDESGSRTWSYRELAVRVEATAARLLADGLQVGVPVAILAEAAPAWQAAALGTLHAGGVVVPIDAQLPDDQVERILRDSGAEVAFVGPRHRGRIDTMGLADAVRVRQLDPLEEAEGAAGGDGDSNGNRTGGAAGSPDVDPRGGSDAAKREIDLPPLEPNDRAVLFYTSGTTGPAKGVPLTHENLAFQLRTVRNEQLLDPTDRLLLPLPTHHVYPFVIGILVPLSYAIPIVYPHSRTGPELVRALRTGDVTALLGVPRLYRALVDALEDRVTSGSGLAAKAFGGALDLSYGAARMGLQRGKMFFAPIHRKFGPKLRLVASGGAPLDDDLERRLVGLGWQVAIGYGLTETSPLLTIRRPGQIAPGTVGTPIEGIEVRIDPEHAPEAASGPDGSGEVQARGPSVFGGYHRLPDETEAAFTHDGWFRTGDLGVFDDEGRLVLLGRASTLIVTEGGENVRPSAVEAHYAEHRAIREIGVLEREGRLVGLVVPEPRELLADETPADAARAAVRERSEDLPSYQRLADVEVTSEPLPRTRLGDLRRHLLEERYDGASGESEDEERSPVPVSEMAPADRELLEEPAARETWEILVERFPDRRVTPDTSPRMGLGIDSLAWVDLTLEIERRTGAQLGGEAVERVESVRDLLQEVADASSAESEGHERVRDPLEEPEDALSERQRSWLEPRTSTEAAVATAVYAVVDKTLRLVWRLRVEGWDRVPDEPVLFAPNHVSYLDPFALAAALPPEVRRNTQWAGSENVMFGNAAIRRFARLAWTIPVESGRAATASLALGAAALQRGRNLVWFPEGRRSPTGELGPFTRGAGTLLDAAGVPAVPVHLVGTSDALPMHAFWPRPNAQVTVRFGAPARADELAAEGSGDARAERIANALRARLMALIDGAGASESGQSSSGG